MGRRARNAVWLMITTGMVVLLAANCTVPATPTATSSPMPTLLSTPTVTPTPTIDIQATVAAAVESAVATREASATPTPTATFRPMPTPTSTPTAVPTPTNTRTPTRTALTGACEQTISVLAPSSRVLMERLSDPRKIDASFEEFDHLAVSDWTRNDLRPCPASESSPDYPHGIVRWEAGRHSWEAGEGYYYALFGDPPIRLNIMSPIMTGDPADLTPESQQEFSWRVTIASAAADIPMDDASTLGGLAFFLGRDLCLKETVSYGDRMATLRLYSPRDYRPGSSKLSDEYLYVVSVHTDGREGEIYGLPTSLLIVSPIYVDPRYGYRIRYPAGFTLSERFDGALFLCRDACDPVTLIGVYVYEGVAPLSLDSWAKRWLENEGVGVISKAHTTLSGYEAIEAELRTEGPFGGQYHKLFLLVGDDGFQISLSSIGGDWDKVKRQYSSYLYTFVP